MSAFPALYRHILYRLYRLRRLIACSVLVVVAGAALSWGVAPSLSLFGDPANLLALMLFWTAVVTLSAVMFPTGWIDTLTASIAFALLLTATPYLQLAIAGVEPGGTGISQGMAVMLIFLAWFLLWLLVMAVFIAGGTAMTMPRRPGRHRTVISTDL